MSNRWGDNGAVARTAEGPDPRPLLITGASGVLGWHLCRYFLRRGYRVEATYCRNKPQLPGLRLYRLALEEPCDLRRFCRGCEYSAIIHTAALTHPDECEQAPSRAYAVNVLGTKQLLENLAPESPFIYVSTDLVFNGEKGHYTEQDEPDCLNVYARSKRMAEEEVLTHANGRVLRMAKLYGAGSPFHPCFVTWMRSHFEKGKKVRLFVDQFRSPVYVGDVARALERMIRATARHRLYHLGGPQRLSRCEFGRLYAGIFGYPASLIEPVRFAEAGLVPRGLDCSLDSSRFVSEFGFQPAAAAEGLAKMKEENK